MVVPPLPPPDQEGVPRKDDAPFPSPPAGALPVGDRRIARDGAPEGPKPFGDLPASARGAERAPAGREGAARAPPPPASGPRARPPLPPPPLPPVSPVPRGRRTRRRSAPSQGGGTGTFPVPASARRGPRSRRGTSRFPLGTQAAY